MAVAAGSGAMVITLIGFLALGWTPGSVAAKDATKAAKNAVVAALAEICQNQFNTDADLKKNTVSMEAQSSFGQGSYLERGGWATMPGAEKPVKEVGRFCANLLDIPSATHASEVVRTTTP